MRRPRSLALVGLLFAGFGYPAYAASMTVSPFGTAADGKTVQLVTLRNDHGMTVRFSSRGGAFTEILVPDRSGRVANVVLGQAGFQGWEKAGSFNSVVGRYANRIAGGGFSLDGKFYRIAGANPATGVVLHGGPNSFASQLWTVAPFRHGNDVGAVLTYVSPDGENGFPGELAVTMRYTLTNANTVRLDYAATTTKPTVVNLTNHAYFNIAGADSGPVYNQVLQVAASRWTPTDARQIPTGEIASVEGTPLDFRRPARLADRVYSTHPQIMLAKGIDHNLILDKSVGTLGFAARLTDPSTGRRLEVWTTEPAVQIYSGNNLNGSVVGGSGRTLRQGDGIAFETEHYPDSPNKPNFPSTTLRPGQTFASRTEWRFSVDRGGCGTALRRIVR